MFFKGDALDLSIIIVNYNVKEFLQNLIHSIYKATTNISSEIIIVDNASDDGSEEFVREKFPDIKLFVNEKNLGFSKANNIGLKAAKGEYLLLLNPDTLVSENTFDELIKFFKSTTEAGLAGCKILNPDGTLQLACRRSFPGPWTSFCKVTGLSALFPKSRIFARYNLTYLDENQTYEVDAISGSFMMFTREVYEKVGGLDEQFFMYGEDLDFCYRVQKAGYKVYYVNSTQIIHYKGESTKRSSLDETKFFYNAMHLFVRKHLSSSFLVEIILQIAIVVRKFIAFWGRRKLILLAAFMDFIFFNLTLFAAERFYLKFTDWSGFPEISLPIVYTVPAIIHIMICLVAGAYKKDTFSVLRNFLSIIIGFFIVTSVTFFLKQYAYSRAVLLITYPALFLSLSLWRVIFKLFFGIGIQPDSGRNLRTLVVGTSPNALQVADKLRSRYSDVHNVIGLIALSAKELGQQAGYFKVIGTVENLRKVIQDKQINEIIFTSEDLSYNQMMKIVSDCQNENVEFKLIGQSLDFIVGKTEVSILDDIPLIGITYNISNPMMKFLKSLLDYSLAMFVLFFIYPFIYFTALLTKKKSEFQRFILNVPSVIKGKCSFVGPKEVNNSTNLYLGKKGLTGLWYLESSEGKESEKLDIYYAKNQNVWLDIAIIGKTLNKMWSKK